MTSDTDASGNWTINSLSICSGMSTQVVIIVTDTKSEYCYLDDFDIH
jgi:hypothetical protein